VTLANGLFRAPYPFLDRFIATFPHPHPQLLPTLLFPQPRVRYRLTLPSRSSSVTLAADAVPQHPLRCSSSAPCTRTHFRLSTNARHRSHPTGRLCPEDARWRQDNCKLQRDPAERWLTVRLELRKGTVQIHAWERASHRRMGPGSAGHVHRRGEEAYHPAFNGIWIWWKRSDTWWGDIEYVLAVHYDVVR
jgi:hypothetical protein